MDYQTPGELIEISPGIWTANESLKPLGMELGHRMLVVRGEEQRLFLFSPVCFRPEWIPALQKLGNPYALVAPNLLHETHMESWLEAIPELELIGPGSLKPIRGKTPKSYRDFSEGPLRHLKDWEVFPLQGIPRIQECLYYHSESETLLVCDLIMNIGRDLDLYSRLMTRVSGLYGTIACSRLFRLFIKDKESLRQSLEPVYRLPLRRIVPGHGDIMENELQAVLQRALRFLEP